MNLYLLRHGLAVDPGTPGFENDADRPLTPKGERKLRKIAEGIRGLEISFDLALSSPYVRARRTAEIVAEVLGISKKLGFSDALMPAGSVKNLIESLIQIEPAPEDVLLVGHEPYMSELISLLVSGQVGFAVVMKKAGLCKLSVESLHAGRCATLEWLLTPKQMALMA